MTTDNEGERIFKRVSACRRANPRLSFNQAMGVVLAAQDLHRDDQRMDLTIMVEELRGEMQAIRGRHE